MTDPFLGEIRMFAGNFAPTGWAFCNGQLMPISQSTALFALLGTSYGGDGRATFALPNLQGCVPLQQGQGYGLSPRYLGERGGTSTVALLNSEMPLHTHQAQSVDAPGDTTSPADTAFAQARNGRVTDRIYSTDPPNLTMDPQTSGISGGGQPHNNMPPYLCVSFIIALQGIYPARP